MRKVLFTGGQHVSMSVLLVFVMISVVLSIHMSSPPIVAGSIGLLYAAFLGHVEAFSFLSRTMTWDAARLVPAYELRVWMTSIGIVGGYVALGTLLAFAIGCLNPPIGLAIFLALALLAVASYSKRKGSRLWSISLGFVLCAFLATPLTFYLGTEDLIPLALARISSPTVQFLAAALAVSVALFLKKETQITAAPSTVVVVPVLENFSLNVTGRFRIGGWMYPSSHLFPALFSVIPIFVIIGVSHVSFAEDGSDLLQNHFSVISAIVGIIIYFGTSRPLGLLKNPGRWLGTTWRFGVGRSRYDLCSQYVRKIVTASIVPLLGVLVVATFHAFYIEAPSEDWPGYANFYDEALLLITINLIAFTWACASYPRRTTEVPGFIPLRIVSCAAACLVFLPGVDLGFVIRVFLFAALTCSAVLAVYIGGRRIAGIDFVPLNE